MADQNSDPQKDVTGIALPTSLKHLRYFNGRFMTAQDMILEQDALLMRHKLGQMAQGPGITYGLHVSLSSDRKSLLITAGHASDGAGQDLFLSAKSQVAISDLVDAYKNKPWQTSQAGPVIRAEPIPKNSGPLTGLFLVVASKAQKFGPAVEELGSQCSDSSRPCKPGSLEDGIAIDLVHVNYAKGLPGTTVQRLGWGARAYFEKEGEQNAPKLNRMTVPLENPRQFIYSSVPEFDQDLRVPLAAAYVQNNSIELIDIWTARRLRSPTEELYWFSTLLQPATPSQLARVLQFQTQLAEAIGITALYEPVKPKSLWEMGFTELQNGTAKLVLPGCGFLPVDTSVLELTDLNKQIELLDKQIESYMTDTSKRVIPYEIRRVTQGEMNALFHSSLASGALWLEPAAADSWRKRDTRRQITIWYSDQILESHPTQAYRGYVMFTWPMNQDLIARIPTEQIHQEYHVCVQTESSMAALDDDSRAIIKDSKLQVSAQIQDGYDSEWSGLPDRDAGLPVTIGKIATKSSVIYTPLVDGVTVEHEVKAGTPAISVTVTAKAIKVSLAADGATPPNSLSSTKEVAAAVNKHADAKKLVVARGGGDDSWRAVAATPPVALAGYLHAYLQRFRARVLPATTNLTLWYAFAVKKDGSWTVGEWNKASDLWLQGQEDVDPSFPTGRRPFIHGIAFKLEGSLQTEYVVRYQVAGKVVVAKGAITEIREICTSEFVNSDARPNDPSLAMVYASDDVDKQNPLPIHRILVKVLPKCGAWP